MPEIDVDGLIQAEPIAVLDRKLGKSGNRAVVYVLIQWSNAPKEEATWELYSNIEKKFPKFNLQPWGQACFQGGRIDTDFFGHVLYAWFLLIIVSLPAWIMLELLARLFEQTFRHYCLYKDHLEWMEGHVNSMNVFSLSLSLLLSLSFSHCYLLDQYHCSTVRPVFHPRSFIVLPHSPLLISSPLQFVDCALFGFSSFPFYYSILIY